MASAVKLEADGDHARALPILSQPALRVGTLGLYADYYKGLAELRLGRADEARRTFQALQSRDPVGFLAEAAALREAEAGEALGDHAAALRIYERLSETKTTAPDDVLMRLGRAAKAIGRREEGQPRVRPRVLRVPVQRLRGRWRGRSSRAVRSSPAAPGTRRRSDAPNGCSAPSGTGRRRGEFEAVRNAAQGDDRERVDLRLAECDYFLKRPRNARDALRPYHRDARRARAKRCSSMRWRRASSATSRVPTAKTVRRLIADFPTQTWAEEALNNLATHYILPGRGREGGRDVPRAVREVSDRPYAERAAWKIGWWAYQNGHYADTVRVFDVGGGATFRGPTTGRRGCTGRAARYEALNDTALAEARYALTATDYLNIYYGRLAIKRLAGLGVRPPVRPLVIDVRRRRPSISPRATRRDHRSRLAAAERAGRPRAARARPLRPGARRAALRAEDLGRLAGDPGDAGLDLRPAGTAATGTEQFALLRGAINAMKRAYPQYLAAGGETAAARTC